ncbi:MAG: hypothetical protein ACLUYK_00590 [Eggerthella lenta]
MSRVAYGQKGYSGASMSVNARAAYEAGEMLRSKWTKTAILGALRGYCDEMDLLYDPAVESETKAALFDRFIASSSWHHTGAYARETEFFALDEAAVVGVPRARARGDGRARPDPGAGCGPGAGGGTASEGSGMPIRVPLLLLPI